MTPGSTPVVRQVANLIKELEQEHKKKTIIITA